MLAKFFEQLVFRLIVECIKKKFKSNLLAHVKNEKELFKYNIFPRLVI